MTNLGIMASQISGHLYDGPFGAYDSLATVTLSSATSTIAFAGVPSGYKHLQIRGIARSSISGSGADNIAFRINGDTGSNYTTHNLYGNGASVFANSFVSSSYGYIPSPIPANGVGSNIFGVAVIDILDYASVNKTKTFRVLSGFDDNTSNATNRIQLSSTLWNSTSAITQIEFSNSGNYLQYSSFALYGVK
jgi:hypothetical protein